MFIHDIPPLMFDSNYYLMSAYIDMYNLCDVVVVPSEKMRDRLIERANSWEGYHPKSFGTLCLHSLDLHNLVSRRKWFCWTNRFPHVLDWKQTTPLHVYAEKQEGKDYSKVHLEGWRNKHELLLELSKGGLVWSGVIPKIQRTSLTTIRWTSLINSRLT